MTTISFGGRFVCLAVLVAVASSAKGAQSIFGSPEQAAEALVGAIEAGDGPLFLAIAGDQMSAFWSTENPIRDSIERDRLVQAAHAHGVKIVEGGGRLTLYIGTIVEPFPAPLVKTESGWRFDAKAGSVEVTKRRIRQNEAAVVELCHRAREAQFTYFGNSPQGRPAFAAKIRSAGDEHDGLFWPGDEGDESPLGPVFAAAAYDEQQPGGELQPLFGYYFRILSDSRAKRGAAHFAFIAWPAHYAVTGTRSFFITQSGEVFQRDLGQDGTSVVVAFTGTRPDKNWSRLDSVAVAPTIARNRK